nr:Chain B, COLLAGEN-LIKE PEPTIDE1A3I_C Chain C, COLLAGEN-LIKE PEPTIDE1A3J_B Chain B, COLLAGEN-LIKE PEPTIDE1A3J_C Chain C, COLLAGEN-LIKE PEPTIDE1G9W_B Chain B, COLLAGEN-LIKE PEPTIDE1G9W_C Chain C, COLLAGEN-LIKE PEPTIDE
PPGPPG